MNMTDKIDIQKVKSDAEENFRCGNFYCSESIISSIRKNIDPDMPEAFIAAASGFPIGVGRSKCMCGAISGAIIGLGYFFGRTEGKDPKVNKTLELANEIQMSFQEKHKVSCCKILTKGMDMASGEHKAQCIQFTGEMAEKVAEVIARELNIETV
nr:C-GCAxxG-C-C family (seleno)protein [Anaeropeptidivorans aminofermentans]